MKKTLTLFTHRRGVAPVIANILLIAIAVVGGTMTLVFAQGNYNSSQISGGIDIEFIQIMGYDTRTSCELVLFGGYEIPCSFIGLVDDAIFLKYDERIAVYVTNHSTKKILLSELMFGGNIYNPTSSPALTQWDDSVNFVPGQYAIMDSDDSLLIAKNNEVQPGQTVTIVLDLESNYKTGRSVQFRIATGNGAVYADTIIVGEHKIR